MLRGRPETLWSIGLRMGRKGRMTSAAAALPRPTCLLEGRMISSGLVKEKHPTSSVAAQATTTKPPVVATRGNVLGAAAEEAQRLSDLAAQNRNQAPGTSLVISSTPPLTPPPVKKRKIDEATMQSALEGAQKLLLVTTSSSPLQDAIQNKRTADPDIQKQISTLHRAFLAVTSWCLDMVDAMDHDIQKDPRMLDKALEVARRAHQLQLPFHLPLHQRLMASVARYYDPELQFSTTNTNNKKQRAVTKILKNQLRSPGGMVLEIAERAAVSLGPNAIPSSHFFRDSLVAFAERRRFRDVLTVLKGMESQFRIVELELDTLAHLLAVLTDQVEEDATSSSVVPAIDSADFLEILSMLNPYVWKTMSNYGTLSDMLLKQNMEQQEDELDEEHHDRTTTDQTQSLLPTLPSNLVGDTEDKLSSTRRKKSLDIHRKKDDLHYFRGWIYHHNESSSEQDRLPDITAQIEELYDVTSFRYSEELERSILNRCLADEDDSTLAMMDADEYLDDEDVDILSDAFPDEDSDWDPSSDDDDDDETDSGGKV